MRSMVFFIFVGILGMSTSCFNTAKLTKRYKKCTYPGTGADSFINSNVKVKAFVVKGEKSDPPKPKNILDLAPKAQAAMISALSASNADAAKINGAVFSKTADKLAGNFSIEDNSNFDKRIEVSVMNLGHNPGDRINKITADIAVGSGLILQSCNKLTTEFSTVDLAKLNYSNTRSQELSGSASGELGNEASTTSDEKTKKATGKLGADVSGKISGSQSYSEEVALKQRIVALSPSVNQNTLTLYQDGISGIDLTGNILADVAFTSTNNVTNSVFTFENLLSGTTYTDAPSVKTVEKVVIYPNLTGAVSAVLSYTVEYRHIAQGGETITESDDVVELYCGAATSNVTLMQRQELEPKLWKLTFSNDAPNYLPVQIVTPGGSCDLLFDSYQSARDFAMWLKEKFPSSGSGVQVGTNPNRYDVNLTGGRTRSDLSNLIIRPFR